jgi:hypothetical protein
MRFMLLLLCLLLSDLRLPGEGFVEGKSLKGQGFLNLAAASSTCNFASIAVDTRMPALLVMVQNHLIQNHRRGYRIKVNSYIYYNTFFEGMGVPQVLRHRGVIDISGWTKGPKVSHPTIAVSFVQCCGIEKREKEAQCIYDGCNDHFVASRALLSTRLPALVPQCHFQIHRR